MRTSEAKTVEISIPCGKLCGHNCADNGGCAHWDRYKKDNNGRQYCRYYGHYYYPYERQGCLSFR